MHDFTEDAAPFGPKELISEVPVSRETLAAFEIYAERLTKWNAAINLVGPDSLADLWRRHFLDSAQLLHLLPSKRPLDILDLGSGAGFPGLVLALLSVGRVHLVESDLKKCAFLREVIRATGAQAQVHSQRIETLEMKADLVTARALAPLAPLWDYAARFLEPGGQALFLKGRRWREELDAFHPQENLQIETYPSKSDPEGRILRIVVCD